jgi:hypothetical protein
MDIRRQHLKHHDVTRIWRVVNQNATATISARQQIASASQIEVTFNFRFGAHNGLKSDSEPSQKSANKRRRCMV